MRGGDLNPYSAKQGRRLITIRGEDSSPNGSCAETVLTQTDDIANDLQEESGARQGVTAQSDVLGMSAKWCLHWPKHG